jgi:hypothetical protein
MSASSAAVDEVAAALDDLLSNGAARLGDLETDLQAWAGPREVVLYGAGRNGRALMRILTDARSADHQKRDEPAAPNEPGENVFVLDDRADHVPDGWRRLAGVDALDPARHVVIPTPIQTPRCSALT